MTYNNRNYKTPLDYITKEGIKVQGRPNSRQLRKLKLMIKINENTRF